MGSLESTTLALISKYPKLVPFWANLGLPKNAKMVSFTYQTQGRKQNYQNQIGYYFGTMAYDKRDRGLLVAILGICQVIRSQLHFLENGWSNPSYTITSHALLINMRLNKCDKHIPTLQYRVWGCLEPSTSTVIAKYSKLTVSG